MQPDPRWTTEPLPAPSCEGLHERFTRIARARPDATALDTIDRRVTYAELDAVADAWAAGLAAAGVARGDLVPILLPRGAELVTALLAVLKTGAAYALLDPAWPAARLREVTEQLGASILVADVTAAHPTGLPVWSPPTGPVAVPPGFRPVTVAAEAPCCVFFTSGTTGRPKAVLTPHRATARLFSPGTFAAFDERTVVPLAAPVPWDAFSLELWAALLSGGTSVVISEPYLTAESLRTAITRHGVTTAWLTSSLFNMILDEQPEALHGLRELMIGGERLSPTHVARFLRLHPDVILLNGYGPVENTVFATTHRITPADCDRPGGIPLGRPVPGTEVHVLDGDRPCADGEVGEICLAGTGLALGYLGDEALTAAKFTTVRIDGRDVRVYRTGDLGRTDDDGLLHFCGRADRQVKLRGHRIEPAEVERRVEQLLPVHACRVVMHHGAPAGPCLVAFCVPAYPDGRLDGALDVLRAQLPGYQVPAEVVRVAAFPVTDQGKLDERALLAMLPDDRAADAAGTSDATGTADSLTEAPDDTTRVVAAVFAAVLGRRSVPVDVPFADLGGNSLAAGRVCARLASALDRPVPLSRFVEHATVTALAGWLRCTAEADRPAPVAAEMTGAGPVPLSPIQLVYLARYLLEPADLTSHCLLTWIVEGDLDRAALEAAIAAVHDRHEPLRAAYLADPRPVAQVVAIDPPPLEVLPEQPSVETAIDTLRQTFTTALIPDEADVWRIAVAAAGPATILGCVVHHIAFDGWSESVLAQDLATFYNAALRGAEASAPAPPSLSQAHRHYVQRITDAGLDVHREHLRADLAGVPALRWPEGSTAVTYTGPGLVEVRLPPAVGAAVDARATEAGVSRFVVLLTDYAAALAEVTGQRDFAVGIPVAQRHGPASEWAVGCYLTVLCVRLRGAALSGGTGATREVGRIFGRAFAAQDVPFQELLGLTDPPGDGRPPLFQTLFALQDNAAPRLDLDGAQTTFIRQPYLDLPLELHAELWPQEDGGLLLTVYFRPDVVPEATASELAKRIGDRLQGPMPGVLR